MEDHTQRLANGLSQKFAKPVAYDSDFVIRCTTFAEAVIALPDASPRDLAEAFLERVHDKYPGMTKNIVSMMKASIDLVYARTASPEQTLVDIGERSADGSSELDVAQRIVGDLFTPLLNGCDRNLHRELLDYVFTGLKIEADLNLARTR